MAEYTYQKTGVDSELLAIQINANIDISQNVLSIDTGSPDILIIRFSADLSESEQTVLAALVTAHDASQGGQYQAIHKKETITSGKLTKDEWFETCDSQGAMTGLAMSNDYTWSGSTLLSRTEKQYFKGGVVKNQHEYEYITVSGNRIERKVS